MKDMLSLTPFKDDKAVEMIISCEQFLMFKYRTCIFFMIKANCCSLLKGIQRKTGGYEKKRVNISQP